MQQQIGKWNHSYIIETDHNHFQGTANRLSALGKRKISLVTSKQEVIVNIIETSRLPIFLEKIPVVSWFLTVPYTIEIKGEDSGIINLENRFIQAKFFANIKGSSYSCYRHLGGQLGEMYSIFKDNYQIGMVRKSRNMEWNAHVYEAEFDDDTDEIVNSTFVVLIDVWWNNTDVSMNGTVYQTSNELSWGLDMRFGKKPDLNWKPNSMKNTLGGCIK